MKAPLSGYRVLDLTIYQQGPSGTTMLADLGAEVIKIEEPVAGDPGRLSMYLLESSAGVRPTQPDYYFGSHNRGKKSLAIDLKHKTGQEIMHKLAEQSDVFAANIKEETLERLNLGYPTLSQINPRLIYALATGFGTKGPDSNRGGFDLTAQARSGLMNLITEKDHPPLDASIGLADQMGGILLSYGVITALLVRERTGQGQKLDVSLLGGMIALQTMWIQAFLLSGQHPEKKPRSECRSPFWNTYRAKDGKWFCLTMGHSDRYWPGLCHALGREDLENDPCFDTHDKRIGPFGNKLVATLDKIFREKNRDEWLELLDKHGQISGPINDYHDLIRDAQVWENRYLIESEHPTAGPLKVVGFPVQFSETPAHIRPKAPEHGEQSEEILREILGYKLEEIQTLKEKGIIKLY